MSSRIASGFFALAAGIYSAVSFAGVETPTVSVSEPGTLGLLAAGVVAAILVRRRGRK